MEIKTCFYFEEMENDSELLTIPFSGGDFAYPMKPPKKQETWSPCEIYIQNFLEGGLNIRSRWIDYISNETIFVELNKKETKYFWNKLKEYVSVIDAKSLDIFDVSDVEKFDLLALIGLLLVVLEDKDFGKLHTEAYKGYYLKAKRIRSEASDSAITKNWLNKLYSFWFDFTPYDEK